MDIIGIDTEARNTIIAIPSDLHCGSPVGLFPPIVWALSSGGQYAPNKLNDLSWQAWKESWLEIKEIREKINARLIVVHNGDGVEGVHHRTTEVITYRIDEHERIHKACMTSALEIAGFNPENGDSLFYVFGTPAHVGEGGASEENIAREMGAIPMIPPSPTSYYQDGVYLWDNLRLVVNNRLFDIRHQGPHPGGRPWLKGNNFLYMLRSVYLESLRVRGVLPDYVIRSHRHTWIPPVTYRDEDAVNGNVEITGFLTPCFQAKTSYGHRVTWEHFTNIGMLYFIVSADGHVTWRCPRVTIEQIGVYNADNYPNPGVRT